MVIFIGNSNSPAQIWSSLFYYVFYYLAHGFYSLIGVIAVFHFVEFYFKKSRVFLYVKDRVIIKRNLSIDPCVSKRHIASIADLGVHIAFNLSRFIFIKPGFHGIIMIMFAVADVRISVVVPSAWNETNRDKSEE